MSQNKAIWGIILLMVMVFLPYANAALPIIDTFTSDSSSNYTCVDWGGGCSSPTVTGGQFVSATGAYNTRIYKHSTTINLTKDVIVQARVKGGSGSFGVAGIIIGSNVSFAGTWGKDYINLFISDDGTNRADTQLGINGASSVINTTSMAIDPSVYYNLKLTYYSNNKSWESYVNGNLVGNAIITNSSLYSSTAEVGFSFRAFTSGFNQYADDFNVTVNDSLIPISVQLISPVNQTTISDIGTNFTVVGTNLSAVAGTWKNVTYYIWDNASAIHNQTTIILNSQTFNNTLFIDDFMLGNYTWNARAGYTNATGLYYVWATNNLSFNVVPFTVLETHYNPAAVEGSLEQFYTNISIISFERMSTVSFVYNGTMYPVTPVEYDTNEWYMPYNLTIPTLSANTNLSFYWSVRLESGLIYNTTSINQTIYNLGIDNCSTNTNQLFNLTMKDETLQTTLSGAGDNTSIKVSVSLDSINGQIVNYSTYYNKTNPARVCINYPVNTSMLYMDATIEFSSTGRFVEFYNIRDYVLTNTTQSQNITLYNLNSSVGQEYKITYKGLDFTPVSDLLIQIQRKYVDEGVFKTIEIPASGTNGYTIAHLVTNDVIYNLIFIKDGVILDSFTDVIATCQNPSFTECEINLNAAVGGTDLIGLVEEEDFFSSLSYNTATRTISSLFGITSGVSGNTSLQVYLIDNFGNISVCSDSLIAAGGTLSCTIPSTFGNASVQAIITLDGETRRNGYISLASSPKEKYAGILVFMAIIMLLFILGIAIQDNPMIMGVFLIVGLFILVALNMVYSTSWLGAGATALWFVIAVVMILIKGGSKR